MTRAEIARVALELVDRVGVARFSMRTLAEALGVTTMAVYHHFDNKAEVLQAAADQVWIESALAMVPHDDPAEDLIQAMLVIRRTFMAHTEVTTFAFASPTTEEAIHATAVAIVERFERAGFRGADVASAYNTLASYTLGSAVIHAERQILDRAIRGPVSDLATMAEAELPVPEASWDAYRSVREVLLGDPDLVQFERGLRDIVRGLLATYVDR